MLRRNKPKKCKPKTRRLKAHGTGPNATLAQVGPCPRRASLNRDSGRAQRKPNSPSTQCQADQATLCPMCAVRGPPSNPNRSKIGSTVPTSDF
ncbi:hypothetical protein ACFX15_008991 [Malus domestica]